MRYRKFAGEADMQAMMALARVSRADNLHVVDLPYRLSSWALDDVLNVSLWVDAEDHLLAWAVMQAPFWTVDYVCHPQASRDMHEQVLTWAGNRARLLLGTPGGHPMWFVMCFADQVERIHDLLKDGFACQADVGEDSWSKVLLRRPAAEPVPEGALPRGFTIRPLAGEREVEAYVQLHRAAFESRNMTVEWRMRTLHRPEYVAALDLVAVAPDGYLGAFCIAWLDRADGRAYAHIEPLGVRANLQERGLGRAILNEALRRLHDHGVHEVYVETDKQRNAALALYQSAGFRVIRDVCVYRKSYEGG